MVMFLLQKEYNWKLRHGQWQIQLVSDKDSIFDLSRHYFQRFDISLVRPTALPQTSIAVALAIVMATARKVSKSMWHILLYREIMAVTSSLM